MVGSKLGPYHVVERIGTGGMGEVYRAHDERLRRDVALKLLPAGSFQDTAGSARLRREARTLSQLNHPHIAAIYDVGSEVGHDYLVLELVLGGTLADRIRKGPIEVPEVLRLGIEVAEGLGAAHDRDIIHRDLKPGNIALDPKDRVKLLDFGLAQYVPVQTRPDAVSTMTTGLRFAGTLPYMAPEQLRGANADVRTDLYALGVVLFESATGRRPFDGPVETAVVDAILHQPAPHARALNPAIPESLDALIDRLMSKRPQDRYASALDVVSDLRRILEDPKRARVNAGRSRRRLTLIVAGATLLTVIAGFLLARPILHAIRPPSGVVTVVVFPLEVLGQAEGAEYAGRAFAEAVSVHLAQATGVEVLPVPVLKPGSPSGGVELGRIASKLGATRAVTGTVVRSGDSLQATVSVVDPRRSRILWGRHYAMEPSNVGNSATELARELVATLGLRTPRLYEYFRYESGTPEMAEWRGLPALLSALRGHRVQEGLRLSDSLVARFPLVPEAHVMRLVALVDHGNEGLPGARDRLRMGIDALERAEPDNPNVVVQRSSFWTYVDRNPRRSIDELTRVLRRQDLRPGLRSHALRFRANAEWMLDDRNRAMEDMERAIEFDPGNAYNYTFLAGFLAQSGRLDEALRRRRQAAAIDPSMAALPLADLLFRMGHREEALAVMHEDLLTDPDATDWAFYAVLLARAGKRSDVHAAAREAERYPMGPEQHYLIASAWAYAHDRDRAITQIERAVELGFDAGSLAEDSAFVAFRDDPRFLRMIRQKSPPARQPR
ncbi:MAG: protein kinase domain-containing protein [Candidatus Eiseniibacteriota bacterium]